MFPLQKKPKNKKNNKKQTQTHNFQGSLLWAISYYS